MKTFKKYNSIENTYREEHIHRILSGGFDRGEFVVQEKVHGANFSFWCVGHSKSIRYAKRTDFIEAGEEFYTYQIVAERYESAIYNLFSLVKERWPQLTVMTVFGELFGGGYPHDDVERDKQSVVIQKGIYYSPSNDFYAFDIMIDNERYLTVDDANDLFSQAGLFYAKTLFRGTFSEAFKHHNAFETNIPKWLDLPPIENNICEGVIIKPVEPTFFPSGLRFILKNKNETWEEIKRTSKLVLAQDKISDSEKQLSKVILNYVTLNRLNNIISKTGQIDYNDFGRVIGMLSKDVLEDFSKDHSSEYDALEKKEQKRVKKSLNTASTKLIKEYLLNLKLNS